MLHSTSLIISVHLHLAKTITLWQTKFTGSWERNASSHAVHEYINVDARCNDAVKWSKICCVICLFRLPFSNLWSGKLFPFVTLALDIIANFTFACFFCMANPNFDCLIMPPWLSSRELRHGAYQVEYMQSSVVQPCAPLVLRRSSIPLHYSWVGIPLVIEKWTSIKACQVLLWLRLVMQNTYDNTSWEASTFWLSCYSSLIFRKYRIAST